MNSLRLFILTIAGAALTAPFASAGAPAESALAACMAPSRSLEQRHVEDRLRPVDERDQRRQVARGHVSTASASPASD